MADKVFVSALAMALIFMLYVLANLYFEGRRPRRRVRPSRDGVIAFRTTLRAPAVRGGTDFGRLVPSPTGDASTSRGDLSPVVLPIGVRRLATKRAARS